MMDNQLLQMPNPMILPTGEHLPAKREGHYEPIKDKPLRGPHVADIVGTPKPIEPQEDEDLGVWGHHIWTAGDAASAFDGLWDVRGDVRKIAEAFGQAGGVRMYWADRPELLTEYQLESGEWVNFALIASRTVTAVRSVVAPPMQQRIESEAPAIAQALDPLAEVKKAFADGRSIQMRDAHDKWEDIPAEASMAWIFSPDDYRIKPDADPYAHLKAAQKEGKTIQVHYRSDERWQDVPSSFVLSWSLPAEFYRIKTEPSPEEIFAHWKAGGVIEFRSVDGDRWLEAFGYSSAARRSDESLIASFRRNAESGLVHYRIKP